MWATKRSVSKWINGVREADHAWGERALVAESSIVKEGAMIAKMPKLSRLQNRLMATYTHLCSALQLFRCILIPPCTNPAALLVILSA